MDYLFSCTMIEFIHTHEIVIWWLAVSSIITFVATLIVVPLLVVRIPQDYFSHRDRQRSNYSERHPLLRGVLVIGRNIFGYLFIMVGIVMLVLPGQGILTIVIGLMLLNFPGKYRLERWLVTRPRVLRTINWLRRRSKRNPLILD
ncbi:MAG: PGPGW domain-containing protein [Candidatus Scalindua sp.]|nr:PGPGW domain-containing protein [Candidatus Scalindua sp.]